MDAKSILLSHAEDYGLGESGQIDLLCDFIDREKATGRFQEFVEEHEHDLDDCCLDEEN